MRPKVSIDGGHHIIHEDVDCSPSTIKEGSRKGFYYIEQTKEAKGKEEINPTPLMDRTQHRDPLTRHLIEDHIGRVRLVSSLYNLLGRPPARDEQGQRDSQKDEVIL